MKWFDYQKDEREQWAQQDITKAYLAELEERAETTTHDAIAAVRLGNHHGAAWGFGACEAISYAQDLAARND